MNVGLLPDMNNPNEKSFEFPLLFVVIFVPSVLCLVEHVYGRRQKNCYIRCYDRDNSQNNKIAYVDYGSLRSK
ncbi:hypothetical protein MtrunA17_Chr7g0236311 [Medicago truncatula]|uniref:Uncharacterized protein n=1 Tax=Medicago truncatula TaxID=3880 RepID=A0A396H422_MEDTR|nr:hypothetical protein MtrunA17_Chr7g0236311 [Medicago truncatula]